MAPNSDTMSIDNLLLSPDSNLLADGPSSKVTNIPLASSGAKARTAEQKARVLMDFDAKDSGEMTVRTNEILIVSKLDTDPEWMMCQRINQLSSDAKNGAASVDKVYVGKVPLAYLELLN